MEQREIDEIDSEMEIVWSAIESMQIIYMKLVKERFNKIMFDKSKK